jgi:hypothetical protein
MANWKKFMDSSISNQTLELLQQKRNLILVLRHGHRQEINQGSFGEKIELTSEGKITSQRLGRAFSTIPFGEIHSSPILRCVQTAEAWRQGSEQDIQIYLSTVLGDPGPFVSDTAQAGPFFLESSLEQIAQLLVNGNSLPGMRSIEDGAKLFVNYALSVKLFPCLMITHDIVICLLCCYFFGSCEVQKYLPGFLQGFLMDLDSNKISIIHGSEIKIMALY